MTSTDRDWAQQSPVPERLAMFPLGSVLFPELGLPLRIFEPRYRQMIADCLAGDRQFGVVLIERGSEVGGGEQRLSVATTATILDAERQNDGTIGVFSVGTGRVEVHQWLPDDPYPAALVTPYADRDQPPEFAEHAVPTVAGQETADADDQHDVDPSGAAGAVDAVVRRLRSALAHRAEANLVAAPATIELSPDRSVALWQVCGLVPATPLDDYELLKTRTRADRIAAIDALLDASNDQVRFHMS